VGKNVRFAVAVTVAAVMVLALGCGTATTGQPRLPKETEAKLDRLLKMMMEQNGIPGAVAGVWVGGKAWTKAEGKADIEKGTPEKLGYRFRIGSITKTFTATVVLQLVDEGKLTLDDRLDKYIQGFKYGDRITVRQMLNNTSGVYAYDDTPGFTETTLAEPQRRWTPEELIDLAKKGEPYFPPGEGWKYCNTNFVLLGFIAEQVTGKDLGREIEARITRPLGMSDTVFPRASEFGGAHSHGYVLWAGRWGKENVEALDDVTYMNPSWGWAAGAMISTLDDLKIWAKALATGKLVSAEMQKERLTWVKSPGGEAIDAKYGLGIFAMDGLVGHDGMLWGYNCGMYYFPEQDATFVVLFNRGMDQKDGEWVSPDIPFVLAASSILFPGKMPWDKPK